MRTSPDLEPIALLCNVVWRSPDLLLSFFFNLAVTAVARPGDRPQQKANQPNQRHSLCSRRLHRTARHDR